MQTYDIKDIGSRAGIACGETTVAAGSFCQGGSVVILTREQRRDLQQILRSHKVEQRLFLRASIVWQLFEENRSEACVAKNLQITTKTVRKWKHRFMEKGMDGLHDLPRSGAPPKFPVEQRCEVIAIACDKPENYGFEGDARWTLNTLTEAVNKHIDHLEMSRSSVHRTLQEVDLKPHRISMWLHSKDPAFKEKVNDVVALYNAPPEDAVVLCVDEKTGMQATERKYETKGPQPGKQGKYEHNYIRHGTLSLFSAFNTQTGYVTAWCNKTRKAEDLLAFMNLVAGEYRDKKKIIIIWDNLNTHHEGPSKRWTQFNEQHGNKFEFHYTPIHASWVNQVELFFSILQKRCLKHGSFRSVQDLETKVMAFIRRWNEKEGHPFNWTFRGYPLQNQKKEVA